MYSSLKSHLPEFAGILDVSNEYDIVEKRLSFHYDVRPYVIAKYFRNEALLAGSVHANPKTQLKFLRKTLDQQPEHFDALMDLAYLYRTGGVLEKDVDKSILLFRECKKIFGSLIEFRNKEGCIPEIQLAFMYLGCFGVEMDEKEARVWFKEMGGKWGWVGLVYEALLNVFNSELDGFSLLEELIKRTGYQTIELVNYQYGTMLLKGDSRYCNQNIELGLKTLEMCDRPLCNLALLQYYYTKDGPIDESQVATLVQKIQNSKSPSTVFATSQLYKYGYGVEANEEQSQMFWKQTEKVLEFAKKETEATLNRVIVTRETPKETPELYYYLYNRIINNIVNGDMLQP